MNVYIDVLVLENIIINYLILYATSRFVKIKAPSWRILLSATLGTIYVVVLLLMPSLRFCYTAFAKFLLSIGMIAICFWTPKIKEFLKILICFYITTFIFAGGAFAFIYISGSGGFVRNGVYYIFQRSSGILMLHIILFLGIIVKVFYEIIQYKSLKGKLFVPINICINDKTSQLNGLVDTGNSLHDPISNLPVVVAELSSLKDILPVKIIEVLDKYKEPDLNNLADTLEECNWGRRVRLVPFNSLGRENGLLIGFKPDRIFVGKDMKEQLAIVAIYTRQLSHNNDYTALLSPELVS